MAPGTPRRLNSCASVPSTLHGHRGRIRPGQCAKAGGCKVDIPRDVDDVFERDYLAGRPSTLLTPRMKAQAVEMDYPGRQTPPNHLGRNAVLSPAPSVGSVVPVTTSHSRLARCQSDKAGSSAAGRGSEENRDDVRGMRHTPSTYTAADEVVFNHQVGDARPKRFNSGYHTNQVPAEVVEMQRDRAGFPTWVEKSPRIKAQVSQPEGNTYRKSYAALPFTKKRYFTESMNARGFVCNVVLPGDPNLERDERIQEWGPINADAAGVGSRLSGRKALQTTMMDDCPITIRQMWISHGVGNGPHPHGHQEDWWPRLQRSTSVDGRSIDGRISRACSTCSVREARGDHRERSTDRCSVSSRSGRDGPRHSGSVHREHSRRQQSADRGGDYNANYVERLRDGAGTPRRRSHSHRVRRDSLASNASDRSARSERSLSGRSSVSTRYIWKGR
eukprot:TRINITY_DN29427_c0_g1_i2.p1 TRINITY_DN29427_c0_g1~~TRINITY_DN29427_c0_g1_i2.p1  ORF type:complete len:456 (+),score=43.90 TRINITY_DN29427_c0_g1_i2:35-1369(+)